jgi:hypothetical protein
VSYSEKGSECRKLSKKAHKKSYERKKAHKNLWSGKKAHKKAHQEKVSKKVSNGLLTKKLTFFVSPSELPIFST